ncbi:unnamed protein product [Staurois parvus]|uniref:Uncharacterized protein n=1 Tax=Staurois parvus TaxID=386267 RepID=A0ABN9HE58_9NEOB|nr:unnamed protein product [Staurois parvus]
MVMVGKNFSLLLGFSLLKHCKYMQVCKRRKQLKTEKSCRMEQRREQLLQRGFFTRLKAG